MAVVGVAFIIAVVIGLYIVIIDWIAKMLASAREDDRQRS
jgi:hypothetical protein